MFWFKALQQFLSSANGHWWHCSAGWVSAAYIMALRCLIDVRAGAEGECLKLEVSSSVVPVLKRIIKAM